MNQSYRPKDIEKLLIIKTDLHLFVKIAHFKKDPQLKRNYFLIKILFG